MSPRDLLLRKSTAVVGVRTKDGGGASSFIGDGRKRKEMAEKLKMWQREGFQGNLG